MLTLGGLLASLAKDHIRLSALGMCCIAHTAKQSVCYSTLYDAAPNRIPSQHVLHSLTCLR